jgi:hypothetical protein
MIVTHKMKNEVAMLALKRGDFDGHLVEVATDKDGITTITVHTKDEGEK